MSNKTTILGGRVDPLQKLEFKRAARRAGITTWEWVLQTLTEAAEKSQQQAQAESWAVLKERCTENKQRIAEYAERKQSVIAANMRQIEQWKAEAGMKG